METRVFREFAPDRLQEKINTFLKQYPADNIKSVEFSTIADGGNIAYCALVLLKVR